MNIEFDYRFDTNGFFNDPLHRNTLEAAADIWESWLQDDFATVAAGIQFTITNPQTGTLENIVLDSDIDDLVIFVGSSSTPLNISDDAIARGQPDGFDATGSELQHRLTSNDFEPWAGTISFDSEPTFSDGTATSWFFDPTLDTNDDIPAGSIDFFSTAIHEIGHVLGVGSAPIFLEIGAGATFDGANAIAINGGNPIPLEFDLSHIADDFLFNGQPVVLGPSASGDRVLPTPVDLALLADIGYEIEGFTTVTPLPEPITENNDLFFGTIVDDLIDGLGGDDLIQGDAGNDEIFGGAGNDVLFGQNGNDEIFGGAGNDELQGGTENDVLVGGAGEDNLFGQAGSDRFIFGATYDNDTIGDFTVNEDLIELLPDLGAIDSSKIFDLRTNTGSTTDGQLFSQFTFDSGNVLTVFHNVELTPDSFVLESPEVVATDFEVQADNLPFGQIALDFTLVNQGTVSAGELNVNIVYSDDAIIGNEDDAIVYQTTYADLASEDLITGQVEVNIPLELLQNNGREDNSVVDSLGLVVNSQVSLTESITYLPGDIDGDGMVSPADAIFVINRLGLTSSDPDYDFLADLNRDGLTATNDAIAAIDRLGLSIDESLIS